jgi:alkylation response protein AidB-like acyl-CoA dehydrogenase
MADASPFFQDPPRLANTWDGDPLLRSLLARLLPSDVARQVTPHLRHLGERAAGDLLALADAAEAQPPRHVPFDPWGRRVDRLELSPAWLALKRVAAEEGLVATAYDGAHGPFGRVYQHALLYLFNPSAATYLCPLAMTDGGARLLSTGIAPEVAARALPRLITRDPERFWTAGQWMTERTGGSDVGGTSTVATPVAGGWHLAGSKWFTSAIDSDVAFTLARLPGAPAGSSGLSLFYLELRDPAGRLQGIRLERLKDKLGTRALPTAELTLDGTPATLVGRPGEGVRNIALLMNVTRVYNANAAVAGMRRAVDLSRDFARRRRAFGRLLAEHPLHRETLAAMTAETAAGLVLLFRAAELQGREEHGEASGEERALLRVLTPLLKLETGKQAVAVASEAVEGFGGAGYVEDTGLPRLLRDAQVLPIWEGTTNVLALDVLRAVDREGALPPLLADAERMLAPLAGSAAATQVRSALAACATGLADEDAERRAARARHLARALARVYAAALLLAQAERSERTGDTAAPLWQAVAARIGGETGARVPAAAADLEAARRLAEESAVPADDVLA